EGGNEDDQDHDDEVLDERDPDQDPAVTGVQLAAVHQQARQDHRAGDRDDHADDRAADRAPAELGADDEPQPDGHEDSERAADDRAGARNPHDHREIGRAHV